MVKILNTPFGNYGYVLPRDPSLDQLLPDIKTTPVATQAHQKPRVSTYDAKYLRTTNLAKGSQVFGLSDQRAYMKHGLLHQGQLPVVPLSYPLPWQSRAASLGSKKSTPAEHLHSHDEKTPSALRLPSSVRQKWQTASADADKHAGKSTVAQQHTGFANSYAASRSDLGSLASRLGSGNEEPFKLNEEGNEYESERKNLERRLGSRSRLILIEQSQMPFSQLGKLKNKRMHDVYTDMYNKHDKSRRKLILDRIRAAEKIKDALHQAEIEKQRNILKSSTASQQNQLKELREKYFKSYTNRLNLLYTPKQNMSPRGHAQEVQDDVNLIQECVSRISLPREVYGLPENLENLRPETVPSKPLYKFPPGKLSMDSYLRTRKNLPHKFNNVWNKTSPVVTPRKAETTVH